VDPPASARGMAARPIRAAAPGHTEAFQRGLLTIDRR
jgi:hypothetical protein